MEMNNTLTNLSRVMSELEVGERVNTLDERVTAQKAVYLAQVVGVNLGYQFTWYSTGPYSSDLAKDCYNLAEYPPRNRQDIAARRLQEPFASALTKVKQAMLIPQEVTLTQKQWLELLASVHHLRIFDELNEAETQNWLDKEQSSLAPYISRATQSLAAKGMLHNSNR